MNRYIMIDGRPVLEPDILRFDAWMNANRTVATDDLGEARVSTVFLGYDHNYGGGPPILFETMIFGGPHDQYQERYCTREEAEAGHKMAVALVKGEKGD